MNDRLRVFFPLIFTFVLIVLVLTACRWLVPDPRIDYTVIGFSNGLLFLLSLLVFRMQRKAMANANPQVFIRSVMGGMMIKMFIVIIAVVIYIFAGGKKISKAALFISLLLYLVYLAVEVFAVNRLNKRKNA